MATSPDDKDGGEPVTDAPVKFDNSCGAKTTFGFKPWYAGLCVGDSDQIITPSEQGGGMSIQTFVWIAILNIAFDISLAVGYIALALIIFGGFKYIMSQGEPQKMTKAKQTLSSAIIGTVIAMGASVLVNTVTMALGINIAGGWDQHEFTRNSLENIFTWAYSIAGLIAVIFIIKNGIDMMMSRGNQAATQQAIRGIMVSAAGLVIVVLAAIITSFVIGSIGGATVVE